MSKLTIVSGSNVVGIDERSRELKQLELEVAGVSEPSNRQLVVYAYNFMQLGHPLMAQKQLNKISSGYFDMMIYRDLFHALFAWSLVQAVQLKESKAYKDYEYFLIVKSALKAFDELNFSEKPAFYRFRRDFVKYGETLTK